MADDSFAELAKLKSRLESLGVKIKGCPETAAAQRRKQRQSQDMATLLARCDHVESTVDRQQPSVAAAPQPCASPGPSSPVPTSRDQNPPESPLPSGRRAGKKAFVSAVQHSQKLGARPRSSPLTGLLADYREAEARWNRQKADLRRQLAAEKKRTTKLEANLSKLTALHDSRLVDVKAFKSALQNRDDQIKAGEQRHAHAAAAAARAAQSMSQELSSVTRERDDVKGLLVATLQRLEAVDDVVRRADARNAALEERCATLEAERDESQEAAAAARERAEALLKSQRRMEWQNTMLDRISEVQMVHNRQKTVAMHELLDRGPGDQASTIGDTCTDDA